MKFMKRTLAFLLSVLMLLGTMPITAIPAYAQISNGVNDVMVSEGSDTSSELRGETPTSEKYAITYQSNDAGTISGVAEAKPGDTVTITQTPHEGYSLFSLKVTDADGTEVAVSDNQFTMPTSAVKVKAVFVTDTMPDSGYDDEYNVKVVVNQQYLSNSGKDPENYNDVHCEVFTYKGDSYYAPNDEEEFQMESIHDIKYDITEPDNEWVYYFTSKDFPYNTRLHVDLGGGFTWYKYNYNTIYKICKEPSFASGYRTEPLESTPFSRALKTYDFFVHNFNVLPYPYASKFYTREVNSSEISSNLKLDMYVDSEHPENGAKGYLYINSADQYFVKWSSWENPYVSVNVNSTTHPDTDKITYIGTKGDTSIWEITSTAKEDHTSHLKLTFESNKASTPDWVTRNEADVKIKIIEPSYSLTYNDVEHGAVSGPATAEYGDEITLVPTADDGYTFSRYVVTDSNGNNIRVTDNKFTMPNSNITISTYFSNVQHVSYLSETGEVKYTDALALDGGETELTEGWYVASGNVAYSDKVNITGNVHLILADGATMTMAGEYSSIAATSDKDPDTNLYVYCQSGKTGALQAQAISGYTTNIYGGNISAPIGSTSAVNIYDGNINSTMIFASEGNINIYGGNIYVDGGLWGRSVTLGYTNITDSIYFKYCFYWGPSEEKTDDISIVDGLTLANADSSEPETFSGTAKFEDIKNKTLIPYGAHSITYHITGDGTVQGKTAATAGEAITLTATPGDGYLADSLTVCDEVENEIPVTNGTFTMPDANVTVTAVFKQVPIDYVDADGNPLKLTEPYTVIDENTVEMGVAGTETWYVLKNDVISDNRLSVKGDVNIILCDGAKLTNPRGIAVYENEGSLTVYGQSDGTGELDFEKTAGHGAEAAIGGAQNKNSGVITINGGTVTAYGEYAGAGIGGGNKSNGTVIINGGTVNAKGSTYSSAIGGGFNGNGYVSINGGNVYANGVIGGFRNGTGTISLSWNKASDSLQATMYQGEITLEKAFVDENGMGYTATDSIAASDIADKTLLPSEETAHVYGEPEWYWSENYRVAEAMFNCTGCGKQEMVNAAVTSEDKDSKHIFTATATFGGKTYTDTKIIAIPAAKDIYNLTVADNIDVNILIDVKGHVAHGEEIKKITYTYPDITTQEKKTVTETVEGEDITADDAGYFAKSFTMAIAQANEPITATLYYENGETKEITVSVANYCEYIIENAAANDYPEKLVTLCYAVLEYGKNAAEYFNYEYEAYPSYELPSYFNEAVSITSQAGISKGSVVTGIASTQMFILSKATMRLTFKDDLSGLEVVSVKVNGEPRVGLTAEITENNGKYSVDISGIYATELSKPILLELSDGTKVRYAATDWAKSILSYSTIEKSKALAKSLYYYSKAANDYFA